MPVLANTHCSDHVLIREAFLPFARPDYVEGMLIGDDLDSLLSAMFLHQTFGWPVAGVYNRYTKLWHVHEAGVFREKLNSGKFFAVDLDIYHPAVPSLGHHIIALDKDEDLPGHSHSLNPNALREFSVRQGFARKYPLSTIHFLWWLLEGKNLSPGAEKLVWLADSTFINAQHYRDNVEEWVQGFMPQPSFTGALPHLQSIDFERTMQKDLLSRLALNPLCHPAHSNYRSKHLGLNGFQCQFDIPKHKEALQLLLDLLSEISGWRRLPFPKGFAACWEGERKTIPVEKLVATGFSFAEWLERELVFSYAFIYRDRLNYTVLR